MLLGFWQCALALDPTLDVSQYAHTAWRTQEGFARGEIDSIAQTPDGYLWLGTLLGLFRFDGVRAVGWRPPQGQVLPDSHIRCLLGARNGTLWIGTWAGLVSWTGNRLKLYPQLDGWFINALLEDRQGVVWVGAQALTNPFARLCAISKDGVRCEGDDGRFGRWVTGLHEAENGDLLVGAATGLWRWRPGAPRLQLAGVPIEGGLHGITGDGMGGALVITRAGIRLVDQETAVPFATFPDIHLQDVLRDHNGGVWVGSEGGGLFHVHNGRTDRFGKTDGLSGDTIAQIFEDREGNIWVATTSGLDRFHDMSVATYSARQGLSSALVASVLESRDGSIWISTRDELEHWSGGRETYYSGPRGSLPPRSLPRAGQAPGIREIVVAGWSHGGASLFEDRQGRLWVASPAGGVGYLANDRYTAIAGIPGGFVDAMTEDETGSLWIAHDILGLIRISPDEKIQTYSWQQLGLPGAISRLVADRRAGGLWLGLRAGSVAHFVDGRVRTTYSAADGLAKGRIYWLRMDPDATLWVGADGGLSRIKSGRIATLDSTSGLPCDSVDWMIDDNTGAVWIDTACGIARIVRSDLEGWASAVDKGDGHGLGIHATVFDESDGVVSQSNTSTYSPHAAKSADGRLWFATLGGVGVVDPARLSRNVLRPPVHIEEVIADRKSYEPSSNLRLPPLVRDLQFNYTALSLLAPERLMFRYKLEGHDREWQSVGTRRQAFFNDLAPGNYRFRVIASNNSGVWNEQGAALDFSVAPEYWQTNWFRALCVLGGGLAVWALVRLRVRQVAASVRGQLEVRMAERERIARDLHDTLLQGLQGLLLRFQVAAERIPKGEPAREMLDRALERADEVLDEGRARVKGLRALVGGVPRLPEALAHVVGQLAPAEASPFRITVEGAVRELNPVVREEVLLVAREALINAYRHANASNIEAEITYADDGLIVRVRDDGQGIDDAVLREGRPGRFGLLGMRERAKKMNARLGLWSKPGAGTEVEIRVAPAIAYRQPVRPARRKRWWRKAAAPDTDDAAL